MMKEKTLYKNKMSMFDLVKGVAIFAVVLWHTIEYWGAEPGFHPWIIINSIFGACWMPVFLLSSAYWYKPKPIKAYTKAQINNLLIPFMRIVLVEWFFASIGHYARWGYFKDMLRNLRSLMIGAGLGNMIEFYVGNLRICNIGPMWFILTLCLSGILFNMIMRCDKIKHKLLPILLFTFIGVVFGKAKWQLYCFSAVLAGLLGYYVGYRIKETKFLVRKWRGRDYALVWGAVALCYVIVAILSEAGMYCNAVYIVFGLPMGLVAIRVSMFISKGKDNPIMAFFQKMGRYTSWILMIHTVEMFTFDWGWVKTWPVFAGMPPVVSFAIILLTRWVLIVIGCFMIAKTGRLWTRIKENGISKRIVNVEK